MFTVGHAVFATAMGAGTYAPATVEFDGRLTVAKRIAVLGDGAMGNGGIVAVGGLPPGPAAPEEAFVVSGNTGGVAVGVGVRVFVAVGATVGVPVCRGVRVAVARTSGVGLGSSGNAGSNANTYGCADCESVVCTANK